jgi:hypothetical protein
MATFSGALRKRRRKKLILRRKAKGRKPRRQSKRN